MSILSWQPHDNKGVRNVEINKNLGFSHFRIAARVELSLLLFIYYLIANSLSIIM